MGGPSGDIDEITAILRPFAVQTGGLISGLRAVQARIGHLPEGVEKAAAEVFNLSRAEVKGVISFYSDFHRSPKGRSIIRLCAAEACQAQGGRAFSDAVEAHFALKTGMTSDAGDLTIEHVYCLGLCSAGPAAIVDDRLIARATITKVEAAIAASARGKP